MDRGRAKGPGGETKGVPELQHEELRAHRGRTGQTLNKDRAGGVPGYRAGPDSAHVRGAVRSSRAHWLAVGDFCPADGSRVKHFLFLFACLPVGMYVHPQVDKHHRQALRGSGTQTKSAQSPSYETRFQAQTGQLTADLTQQQSSPSKHADTM